MRNKVTIISLTNRYPRKGCFLVVLLRFPGCHIYLLLLIHNLGACDFQAPSYHHIGEDLNLLLQNHGSCIIAMRWICFTTQMPGSCLAQRILHLRCLVLNASIVFLFSGWFCPTFWMRIFRHARHNDLTAEMLKTCMPLNYDKHDDCFNLLLSTAGSSPVLLLYFQVAVGFSQTKPTTFLLQKLKLFWVLWNKMVQIYKEKVALAVKKSHCYIKAAKWDVIEMVHGLLSLVTCLSH